jgi:nucleoside-diphosphate-sugar epimerase
MNILITGGNGYLARHLASHLSKAHNVYAPGRDQLDCMDAVAVEECFNIHNFDTVIHTALTGREVLFSQERKYWDDAITMWNNVRNHKTKFKQLIHFGSAYDMFDNPYGQGKKAIAESCEVTDNFYNLRLYGNFHYTEKDTRFFKKMYSESHFVISENKQFDYFHLEDIFPIVDFVINEHPAIRAFDVVYKEKRTLISQAMEFCELNEIKPILEVLKEGTDMIGNSTILDSFNLNLQGLATGFTKYKL